MDIKRSGSQPSSKGQAEYFTGTVRIDPLFQANDPARARSQCHVRARRSDSMAQPPAGPDPDRYGWLRPGIVLGRPDRTNSAGGRDLVPAG